MKNYPRLSIVVLAIAAMSISSYAEAQFRLPAGIVQNVIAQTKQAAPPPAVSTNTEAPVPETIALGGFETHLYNDVGCYHSPQVRERLPSPERDSYDFVCSNSSDLMLRGCSGEWVVVKSAGKYSVQEGEQRKHACATYGAKQTALESERAVVIKRARVIESDLRLHPVAEKATPIGTVTNF